MMIFSRPSKLGSSLLLILALGCTPLLADKPTPESDLKRVKERGTLIMLTVPWQENLFCRTNIEAGPMQKIAGPEHFDGLDVELMSEVAAELGVELQIVPAVGEGGIPGYSDLIPALLNHKGDVIASALSITEARRKEIEFSTPYFYNQIVIITRSDRKVTDIGGLAGSTGAIVPGMSLVKDLEGLDADVTKLEVEIILEAYEAVSEGKADFLLDYLASGVRRFLNLFDNLEVAFALPAEDNFALGFRPGSDLREPIDQALERLRKSGRLEEIMGNPTHSQASKSPKS